VDSAADALGVGLVMKARSLRDLQRDGLLADFVVIGALPTQEDLRRAARRGGDATVAAPVEIVTPAATSRTAEDLLRELDLLAEKIL